MSNVYRNVENTEQTVIQFKWVKCHVHDEVIVHGKNYLKLFMKYSAI